MAGFPFTTSQFLDVFSQYNLTVFPFQLILVLLAIFAVALAVIKYHRSERIIFFILSFFWLWMGLVYHILFFSAINSLAYLFGALFIGEAILLLYYGFVKQETGFHVISDRFSAAGLVFIVYSLVMYPFIGTIVGHPYPYLPTFGLPCPTTIFTFGMFLLANKRLPWYLLVIPLLWSCIGFFAALLLGIPEDYGLIIAGVLGTTLILMKSKQLSRK